MTKILAISGSPIRSGNIEKAMTLLLESSQEEYELIRLSELRLKPCIACLKCVENNRCKLKDGMNNILDKIVASDALVIGGFPTFMSLNSLTKIFTERMFPLKHNFLLTKGKLGAIVAGGFRDAQVVEKYLSSFFEWLQMDLVGTLKVGGNPPCLICGHGESCDYSNVALLYGKGAKISQEMFYSFESDKEGQDTAKEIGERLKAAIKKKKTIKREKMRR